MQQVGDEWVVTMEWPDGTENGGPARLVIEPIDKMPVGGLSSTVLRQIDFRDAAERLRDQVNSNRSRGEDSEAMRLFESGQLQSALSKGAATDEYLALLSQDYLRRVNAGQEKPVDRIAAELGRSLATVKGHLWQARKRGLLQGGSAGRKGGELSPEAEQLLETYALAWLAELDRLRDVTPNRRRPQKAITPRTET
jgi:hypothetical protein